MNVKIYYVSASSHKTEDESFLFISEEFGILVYYNWVDETDTHIGPNCTDRNWKEFYKSYHNKKHFEKYHKLTYIGKL